MLRKMIESRVGEMNDNQFTQVLEGTTDYIKLNRARFKKMTYLEDVLSIAGQLFLTDQDIKRQPSTSHQPNPIISKM